MEILSQLYNSHWKLHHVNFGCWLCQTENSAGNHKSSGGKGLIKCVEKKNNSVGEEGEMANNDKVAAFHIFHV